MADEVKKPLTLDEKVQKIVESKKAKAIRPRDRALFETLLKGEMKYLDEASFAGDIAYVGQVLIPVYRRAFPQLIGKDIVGVQPLTQPTGYVFALRHYFGGNSKGNTTAGITPVGGKKITGPFTNANALTPYNKASSDNQRSDVNTIILIYPTTAARRIDTNSTDVTYGSAPIAATGGLISADSGAKILFTQDEKAIVYVTDFSAVVNYVAATGGPSDWIDNIAGYLTVLKTYAGPLATSLGEKLGLDIQELGVTIDKLAVEAQTRKLKSRYTLEAAQDMKSIHGKDMASELIEILTHEIHISIDRDIIDTINAIAPSTTIDVNSLDGRWQAEKFRVLYTQLLRRSNEIAKTTMRGPGNVIVGSSDAVTMLEQLPGFNLSPVQGSVNSAEPVNEPSQSLVGSLGGRFTVYRDIFANTDYTTIGYRGPSNYDSGVIWCPYIPLEMKKTVDPENGNPNIIFMERSALTANIFGGQNYYRRIILQNLFG